MRLGILTPIAALYRLFGVSTLATNFPCLLAVLGIMVIVYAAAETPRAKLLAVMIAMVCTPLLIDGRELNGDLPSGAVMAASILCLSRRDRPRGAWWLVAAVVAWFAAFQVKEVAVWCAPIWLYAVVHDLRQRGARWVVRAFAPAVGVGVGLVAGYLAFCAVVWGAPLARFHGIEDVAAIHPWSLVGHPKEEWVARLTWQPPDLLFKMFRWLLVPVVISPWLVRGPNRIWIVTTATIILLYWFGPTNTAHYMPLPITRRMLLPVLPGVVVLAAVVGDAVLERIRARRWRAAIAIGLWLGLAISHIHSLRGKLLSAHPERAAYAELIAEVASTSDRVVLVCGDYWCPTYANFYFGYERPANLVIVTAADFVAAPLPAPARIRFMVDVIRGGPRSLELARRAEALESRRIAWGPRIRLYDAGDGARLRDALANPG